MKKLLALAIILLTVCTHRVSAQEKCISEIMFREQAAANPKLMEERLALDQRIEQFIKEKKSGHQRTTTPATFIIPVVVHVIHYGGAENISKEQIEDQIRIMNLDYRRQNADTVNTPSDFVPFAADCDIEFRLAQLDPNGNCTDGIERIYSPLTFGARDNVKALSHWPSTKYLNMWVVAGIANTNGSPGSVIGFAQFPGSLSTQPNTDGVVIRQDYFGSIGTAAGPNGQGRTATHEVGHWLDLRHIWGDDAGACTGDDLVSDTPNQANWTLSICPSFPLLDACTGTAPGVMYPNYMDYTNGDCQNMFTYGQADRMVAALGTVRTEIWSPANLTATGTDGTPATLCAPVADFLPKPRYICEGGSLSFSDASYGGEGTSRIWTFQGGTPATDTSANPTVLYSTPGNYNVSLTETNSVGSDTKTINGLVVVSANQVTSSVIPFSESFENGTFPFNDWYTWNPNGGAGWAISSLAASSGTKSLFINNYNGNDKGPDEFITPAFDFTNYTQVQMTFDLAFAFKSTTGTNTDKLIVYGSNNCGETWTARGAISGTALPTTLNSVAVSINFIPGSTQWRNQTISGSSSQVSTKPNVRFRFEFTHDAGNNIYIDNINIGGTVTGVDEINAENSSVNIYPNPSSSNTYVDFTTLKSGHVKIEVMDASGRIVNTFEDNMDGGDHQYQMKGNLEKGVYLVRLTFGDHSITKKAVIN